MVELTDSLRREINRIIPRGAKVGDMFLVSTGDHVRVMEVFPEGNFNYTLFEGPIRIKKVEKKVETQKLPSNTITTSNINLSTSGTSGLDVSIPNVPDIKVNVNTDKKKGKIKDPDPYNWYIKKRLKY
jgi:hypothetical protein